MADLEVGAEFYAGILIGLFGGVIGNFLAGSALELSKSYTLQNVIVYVVSYIAFIGIVLILFVKMKRTLKKQSKNVS
jgi:H+/Cl- antiporter ClcA